MRTHAKVMDHIRCTADQLLDDIEASREGLAEVGPGSPLEVRCVQIAQRLATARMLMADYVVEARHARAPVVDVSVCPTIVEDLLCMLADATNAIDTLCHAATPSEE